MSDNYIEEVRLPSARYEAHFNCDGTVIDRVFRVLRAIRRPVSQQEDQLVREIIRLRAANFTLQSGGKP